MNVRLSDEVGFLRKMIEDLSAQNKLLLTKLIGAPRNLSQPNLSDMEPIQGYVSLNSKIREAEEAAKRDFEESQNADKK